MITRSQKDANYQFVQLPDTKRTRKPKQEPEPEPEQPQQIQFQMQIQIHKQESDEEHPNITFQPIYDVYIDFDEAHREWVKNKVKLQNGCYRYKKETKRNKNK